MRRVRMGDFELSVNDHDDVAVRTTFAEIFGASLYHHDSFSIREEPVIVDVGGNIGLYTLWSQTRYRAKQIFTFEPSPLTFDCLRDNVSRLARPDIGQVHLNEYALGQHDNATLTLHHSLESSMISSLLPRSKLGWASGEPGGAEVLEFAVRVSSLSSVISDYGIERIDILKIDVEGYFLEVLNGVSRSDVHRIRNIVLEGDYLPETGITFESVEEHLIAMGFQVYCREPFRGNNLIVYGHRAGQAG